MARKKDLAGLATLAGLAYMASRDKGGEAPAMPTASTAPATSDAGDFIEAGSGSAPEGEDYGNESRREGFGIGKVAPSATPRPRPRPASNAGMSMSRMSPEAGAEARKKFQQEGVRDMALARAEGERAVAAHKAKRLRQKEADEGASLGGYKKGGSVKGWGSARGARKAKIY